MVATLSARRGPGALGDDRGVLRLRTTPLWAEIQVAGWAIDGGIPLLLLGIAAPTIALYSQWRLAVSDPTAEGPRLRRRGVRRQPRNRRAHLQLHAVRDADRAAVLVPRRRGARHRHAAASRRWRDERLAPRLRRLHRARRHGHAPTTRWRSFLASARRRPPRDASRRAGPGGDAGRHACTRSPARSASTGSASRSSAGPPGAGRSSCRRTGVRVVANGGNVDAGDVNWVHYVHAAFEPEAAGLLNRLRVHGNHARYLGEERRALSRSSLVICNSQRTADDVVRKVGVGEGSDAGRLLRHRRGVVRADRGRRSRAGAPRARHRGRTPRRVVRRRARRSAQGLRDGLRRLAGALRPPGLGRRSAGGRHRRRAAGMAQPRRRARSPRVASASWASGRDMPAIVAACDLLVHPARYEAYGLAVHEALCRGLPALVSASAGVAERYPDDLAGLLLADPQSAAELDASAPRVARRRRSSAPRGAVRVEPARPHLGSHGRRHRLAGGGARVIASTPLQYAATGSCWVCGAATGDRFHSAVLEFDAWREQDPELAAYTGETIWLRRCRACGFAQPERIPALPQYFERMYDQRWSPEWVAQEFESTYKDVIFKRILAALDERVQGSADAARHRLARRALPPPGGAGGVAGGRHRDQPAHRGLRRRADGSDRPPRPRRGRGRRSVERSRLSR